MADSDPARLSEVEIALMDAFKALADVIMAMNPNAARALTTSFEHQRDGKLKTGQAAAVAVFELLRRFVVDPERQAAREQIRRLLAMPPQGWA